MRSNYVYGFFGFLVLGPIVSFGQVLHIGQKMPDITMHHVINYKSDSIRLSEERGKLVILDFWGTGCSGCIASFPTMDKLQKKFGNRIRIIMVNKESEDSTRRFFVKRPWIKLPQLPFATQDSILEQYFPHYLVPEHVWIDKRDTIRAITDEENATAQNIQTLLNGKPLKFYIKADIYGFHGNKPVLAQGDEPFLNKMKYLSSLLSQISGIVGYSAEKKKDANYPYHVTYNYMSIKQLFSYAFDENGKYHFSTAKNSVILCVKDKSKFEKPKGRQNYNYWETHYCYCYDLWVPPSQACRIYDIMKRDFANYFNAYGTVEHRMVECLVLSIIGKEDKLHSKGGKAQWSFRKPPHDTLDYYHNLPFKEFVNTLRTLIEARRLPTPFIDATGYKGNVDIAIPASIYDQRFNMGLLRRSLWKYGLDLKKEERMTNVLVIRDLSSDKKPEDQ